MLNVWGRGCAQFELNFKHSTWNKTCCVCMDFIQTKSQIFSTKFKIRFLYKLVGQFLLRLRNNNRFNHNNNNQYYSKIELHQNISGHDPSIVVSIKAIWFAASLDFSIAIISIGNKIYNQQLFNVNNTRVECSKCLKVLLKSQFRQLVFAIIMCFGYGQWIYQNMCLANAFSAQRFQQFS